MKKQFLLTLICLISLNAIGQNASDFQKKEDFKPAEPTVLEQCNYLLNHPVDQDKTKRTNAFQYIFKWMEGTPDYTFNITPEAMTLVGDNPDLLTIYLSALTKAALDDSEKTIEQ